MMKTKLVLYLILCSLLTSCKFGYTVVQYSEGFERSFDLNSSEIIFISADLVSYTVNGDDLTYRFIRSEESTPEYIGQVKDAAHKNGVKITLYDESLLEDDDTFYYSDFLPLKENMLVANITQDHSFNAISGSRYGFNSGYFTITPKIRPEFSFLSEKYQTPFYGLSGLVEKNNRSYYYMIVVDVVKGEIVYRELKKVSYKIKKNTMQPYIYDSFFTFKNHVK